MTTTTSEALTGSLVLADYVDPRRSLLSDHALDPGEIKRLTIDAGALGGRIVEASTRRLLVFFDEAAKAFDFAQTAQRFATGIRVAAPERQTLSARVILGYGRLAIDGNRVRGDWPHRLAGLISRVPVHCIAGLQTFVQQLPPGTLQTAPRALIDDLLLLQSADLTSVETQMASALGGDLGSVFTSVTLRVRGTPHVFRVADCPILIGRDTRCAVQITSDTASRIHGRVEYSQGKFYYVDDSRNGSWVLIGSGAEIKLSKDRILLAGEGAISPGASLGQQTGEVVRYICHSTRMAMPGEGSGGDTRPLDQV